VDFWHIISSIVSAVSAQRCLAEEGLGHFEAGDRLYVIFPSSQSVNIFVILMTPNRGPTLDRSLCISQTARETVLFNPLS
jgi:hypothetical protein